MLVLASSIMNIALPHAQHALGISDADRQWVVTAYTLGFGGLLLLGGRVADFVGRERVFIAGLLGFAVAYTAGLTALVYGFANAGTHGWASASTVAVLAGAVVLLVLFFIVEAGNEHAFLPLRLLRNRDRAGAYLTATLSAAGLLSMFLFLTFYLQGTLGYSALWAGVAFLPFSVGVAAGAAIAGRVLPRIGPRVPLAAGSALAGLGLVWFSQVGVGSSF
jgi:MFS family permease